MGWPSGGRNETRCGVNLTSKGNIPDLYENV
jgi:hypothetical protein